MTRPCCCWQGAGRCELLNFLRSCDLCLKDLLINREGKTKKFRKNSTVMLHRHISLSHDWKHFSKWKYQINDFWALLKLQLTLNKFSRSNLVWINFVKMQKKLYCSKLVCISRQLSEWKEANYSFLTWSESWRALFYYFFCCLSRN